TTKKTCSTLPHSYLRRRSAGRVSRPLSCAGQLDNKSHLRVSFDQLSANGRLLSITNPLTERRRFMWARQPFAAKLANLFPNAGDTGSTTVPLYRLAHGSAKRS